MGVGPRGSAIIHTDMLGDRGYLGTFVPMIHPALSPGAALDAINGSSIELIEKALKRLEGKGRRRVRLWEWIRHEIFVATTEAIYGPGNPFRENGVEEAW
jgi:hypothetical protein